MGPTSALASTWRGWKCRSFSRNCCPGWPGSRFPACRAAWPRFLSAAPGHCPSNLLCCRSHTGNCTPCLFSQFESEPMNIPQPKAKPELDLDYERIVSDAIQAHQPVADTGVAVAILRYGRLAYTGGFGFRDRAARTPVDEHTLFAIGSATKAFTSTALSILAGTGAFSLDEPIRQIIPSFKMEDPIAS